MNETNLVQNVTSIVKDAGDTVSKFGPFALTVLCVIIVGYALKFAPKFPNNWIPFFSFVTGATIYVLLSDPSDAPFTMRYPIVRHGIMGLAAAAVAWIIHWKFLRDWIDDKYFITTPDGDTKFIKREKPNGDK